MPLSHHIVFQTSLDGGPSGGGDGDHWDQVEPDNVSKLVSMLEGQVSKLDQKLRLVPVLHVDGGGGGGLITLC